MAGTTYRGSYPDDHPVYQQDASVGFITKPKPKTKTTDAKTTSIPQQDSSEEETTAKPQQKTK